MLQSRIYKQNIGTVKVPEKYPDYCKSSTLQTKSYHKHPVMMFTMYLVVLCMFISAGRSIVFGTMETGELTSVIVYAIQILSSLMIVSFGFCTDHDRISFYRPYHRGT